MRQIAKAFPCILFGIIATLTATSGPAHASVNCSRYATINGPAIGEFARSVCRAVDEKTNVNARFTLVGIYFAAVKDDGCVQARYARGETRRGRYFWELLDDGVDDNRHPDGATPCDERTSIPHEPRFEGQLNDPALRSLIAQTALNVLDEVHGDVRLANLSEAIFIFRRVGRTGSPEAWRTVILRVTRGPDGGGLAWQAAFAVPQPDDPDRDDGVTITSHNNSQYREYRITDLGTNANNRQAKVWIRHLLGGTPVMETLKRRCRNKIVSAAKDHFRAPVHHNGTSRNFCTCTVVSGGTCRNASF